MSALARLVTAIESHGPTEMDFRYHDAVRECTRTIRESWLRQEIERIKRRLILVHAMKIFATQEGWCMRALKRESAKQTSLLCERRTELSRLLCGEA